MQAPARHPHKAELRLGRTMGSFLLVFDKLEVITRPVSRQRFPCIAAQCPSRPEKWQPLPGMASHQTHFNQTCVRCLMMLHNTREQLVFRRYYKHALFLPVRESFTNRRLFAKIQLSVRISADKRFLHGEGKC